MTDRELEVLRAVVRHGTYKRAALALRISEQAVKSTIWRARRREAVESTVQLIVRHCRELMP